MSPSEYEKLTEGEQEVIRDLTRKYGVELDHVSFSIKYNHITSLSIRYGDDYNTPEIGFHSMPESFRNLKWLKSLRIHDNELGHLPKWFGELERLEVLDITDNPYKNT